MVFLSDAYLLTVDPRERNCDVPIRNDHDLNVEVGSKVVSRVPRTTVDMMPTGENTNPYSVLSTSWGGSLMNYERILEPYGGFVGSEDEDQTPGIFERYCPLCKKLDVTHMEMGKDRMRRHMRTR